MSKPRYGSDLLVDLLRGTQVKYVSLNPGASIRGIHESIVNYGGNHDPQIILTTHESLAVAIAHGYAKATGQPMAALIHDVVGLQNALVGIFNAWADRVPLVLIGGTGPMDTTLRRPYFIDSVHTALTQGELVRNCAKWVDQPASIAAMPLSYLRAYRLATSPPRGPMYLCLDVSLQEGEIPPGVALPSPPSYIQASRIAPPPAAIDEIALLLVEADSPVIVAGMVGEQPEAFWALVELAEVLGAPVIDLCDMHSPSRLNFPSHHPLDLTYAAEEALANADLVLALDVLNLPEVFTRNNRSKEGPHEPLLPATAKVVDISLRDLTTGSWVVDHQPYPAYRSITAEASFALPALVGAVRQLSQKRRGFQARREARLVHWTARHQAARASRRKALTASHGSEGRLSQGYVAEVLWELVRDLEADWVVAHGNPQVLRPIWDFARPRQHLGGSGGGGLPYALGASLGVALAHREGGTVCINLQGDGDLLYAPGGLWTAAHHRLPLLTVVLNNRSYYQDERHQEAVSRLRGRPVESKTIGIRLEDPPIHLAQLARSMGLVAEGPVSSAESLRPSLQRALREVVEHRTPAFVEVLVSGGTI